jgi:hypothetical protein
MGWNTARKKEGTRYIAQPLSSALRLSLRASLRVCCQVPFHSTFHHVPTRSPRPPPELFSPPSSDCLSSSPSLLFLSLWDEPHGRVVGWVFSAACLLGQPELVKTGTNVLRFLASYGNIYNTSPNNRGAFLFFFSFPSSSFLSLILLLYLSFRVHFWWLRRSYRSDTSSCLFLSSFQVRI